MIDVYQSTFVGAGQAETNTEPRQNSSPRRLAPDVVSEQHSGANGAFQPAPRFSGARPMGMVITNAADGSSHRPRPY
ncbi:MAG: hypothetical protein KDE51_14780 [Anaerolineales bacterium]|nr:hypothetical protein [Anaerolineales bacterium]